ncbi:PAAR domain-containing protein [Klebsiella michiganensis]|nr:PAAR domain-containing protein [Klebsiella michiganensis]
MAGTLDSYSTCPCKAKFIPSMMDDTYEKSSGASVAESAAGFTAAPTQISPELPGYLTGEQKQAGFVSDYPVLRNTHNFPDGNLRVMLNANNHNVMLLTLGEVFEYLTSMGFYKSGWFFVSQSKPGEFVVNYGTSIKDAYSTSKVLYQLGNLGITATVYVNHKGTELIKISGYAGIRKILNAPVFAAKNPQIIKYGIGSYGLNNAIKDGFLFGLIYVSVADSVDFILNDETTLAKFIGKWAVDVLKVGISSTITWGAGVYAVGVFSTIAAPLVVVLVAGALSAWALNKLDDEFKITDKVVSLIESAQQEFVEKAKEMEKGLWDLGAMYVDGMLSRGKEVVEYEVKKYLRQTLDSFEKEWF